MSRQLAECVLHAPHSICGRTLQPLSIWHYWLLDFVGSPLVGASEKGGASDLALAIEICCRPASSPSQTCELPLSVDPYLLEQLHEVGLSEVLASLKVYFADYVASPRVWESEEGRPIRSPLCLYMVSVLMRQAGMSHDEAWATQFGYGRHLCLALAEAGGNEIPLLSAAEERALIEAGYTS